MSSDCQRARSRAKLGENLSYRSSVFARVVNAMNRAMDHLPSG